MKKVSPRQRKFAQEYIKTGNATQSAINAGYKASTNLSARSQGSKLLKNEKVWALIESSAEKAQGNIMQLADKALNEGVRLSANKDILDRAGFQPVTKTQSTTINIQIDNERFNDILASYQNRRNLPQEATKEE